MKYGVIDVGGGLRGIYGAGVLDRCLEEDLRFDLCIGVSAGSANMASYLAGQHGRNKPDRKSTRLNSSHTRPSRMPSSA